MSFEKVERGKRRNLQVHLDDYTNIHEEVNDGACVLGSKRSRYERKEILDIAKGVVRKLWRRRESDGRSECATMPEME